MPDLRAFFDNRNLVVLVDAMARRYGKLPHEVMDNVTVDEFNFNMAIMVIGKTEEQIQSPNIVETKTNEDFAKLGISRKVIKKEGT